LKFDLFIQNPLGRPSKTSKKRKAATVQEEKLSLWTHLIRPELYPVKLSAATPLQHISLLVKVTSTAHPSPHWPSVVRCVLAENSAVARLVLVHFGAFAPAVPEEAAASPSADMTRGCGSYACQAECLGAADLRWPQAVGTSVLKVVVAFVLRQRLAFYL
jgi:hypothetical protein